MPAPKNPFKAMLTEGRRSIGIWMACCDPYVSEAVAVAGFDWVLIDCEHAPNDLASIVRQLQVVQPHVAPVVRLPMAEPWLIKQVLDAGAQSLLIPMVNTAEEAKAIVRAMRYPPRGIRGLGHALGRGSRFGGVPDYVATIEDELCLVVQVESREALGNLDAIMAVDGVDGVFVGPADLAADCGHAAEINHPDMRALVAETLRRIEAAGKPAGIIDFSDDAIQGHFANGARFVAVGADIVLFAATMRGLAATWKGRIG